MSKEILLYYPIYSYSAADYISQMNEVGGSDVVLRWNNDGGELRYGWAVLQKAKELKGKKIFKNDGECSSMAAFSFLYNDNNECIDSGCFNFHRAAYRDFIESDPEQFTQADKDELDAKNAKLRQAMEAKLNVAKFEQHAGCTLDELFSLNGRKEFSINADQALDCGLINKINYLTPSAKEAIATKTEEITALYTGKKIAAKNEPTKPTKAMTKEELKAQHPAVYAEVFKAGVKRGEQKEFERVEAILAFAEIDPKGVVEATKSRKPMTPAMQTDFMMKQFSKGAAAVIEEEAAPALTVNPKEANTVKTEKEKAAEAFMTNMRQHSTFFSEGKKTTA